MRFLMFDPMGKLNLEFNTIPGKESYDSGTEPTIDLFFVSIVTEGVKEEIIYLDYVSKLVKECDGVNFKIVLLNKLYKDTSLSISDSHPKKRLEILKEWKEWVQKHYDAGKDEDWIVCDRDDRSFKEEQFDELCAEAINTHFNIVISNPAFQIWLLFHFVADIKYLKLDQIEHSKQRLALVEKELKQYVKGYKHGSLNMAYFATHIREAINNTQSCPHEIAELKNNSGTNFSDLLISIEKRAGKTLF